jgi:hypothetical protein
MVELKKSLWKEFVGLFGLSEGFCASNQSSEVRDSNLHEILCFSFGLRGLG